MDQGAILPIWQIVRELRLSKNTVKISMNRW